MSNRHRSSKQAAPGATHQAPSKEQRKAANRKARHRTHEILAHADIEIGEEIVAPRPVHTRVDLEKNEVEAETSPKPRREYRHWKQKFWKRRNNIRAMKAQLSNDDEQPLRDVS